MFGALMLLMGKGMSCVCFLGAGICHASALKRLCWVVLQEILSSSKKNAFYSRRKVKRVKGVPVFGRRICFYRNYTLYFDELKNFCNTTVPGVFQKGILLFIMLS